MRDGLTTKLKTRRGKSDEEAFFDTYQARIVVLSGRHSGMEHQLDNERVTLGRGPGVDLAFDDPAMSRQHAAIDFVEGAFRIHDLGSTNGLRVNGSRVQVRDLVHGDRIEFGTQVFQLVIDEREDTPNTYELTP
jgi:pSer/pThr/pTyr-binding forkhead associated (FHA) protein